MTITEHIAEAAHEINRAYCKSLGDESQPAWADAPKWQKDSAIKGVEAHLKKKLTPQQSHEAWMAEKIVDGWVYGPVKLPDVREHPCIVPYSMLPKEQKAKDYLFAAVVELFQSNPALREVV